jgi:tetratricopeptide (TPR) repeat protein
VVDLLELGSRARLQLAIAEHARLAQRSRQPTARWAAVAFAAMQALMEGRFADAERHAYEACAMLGTQNANTRGAFAAQFWWLRIEQGRASDLPQLYRTLAGSAKPDAQLSSGLVRLHAELGDADAARAELDGDFQAYLDAPLEDWTMLPTLANVAVACALLEDARTASKVHDVLRRYTGSHVVAGPAIVYLGPVSLYVGLCLRAMGRIRDAVASFEQAASACESVGAVPMRARAGYYLAEALRQSGRSDDWARAREACRGAEAICESTAAHGLSARIARLERDLSQGRRSALKQRSEA